LIALSATFPTAYLRLLSNLLTVDFTIDNCILRGSPSDFSQREIEMKLKVCGKKYLFVLKGLSIMTDYIEQNSHDSVVIFCNSRNQSLHVTGQLEKVGHEETVRQCIEHQWIFR